MKNIRMTTNVLDGLLTRVDDPDLRAALSGEVALLRENKDFGLVFERHFPENVTLYSHPVKRGVRVQLRDATNEHQTWLVTRVKDGQAVLADADGGEETRSIEELVVIREFGEPIYPGMKKLGSIRRGGEQPPHIVLKGENHHALQTLLYLYEGKVDCVYIDPPYNSGARDWKYNNDYVDETDAYRHSKWLAYMERRLLLAKRLLNPDDSVLIVTIDEKEYLRLGLLLEQIFKGCTVQMTTIVINPKGTGRPNEFSRVDEYAFFVFIGGVHLQSIGSDMLTNRDYASESDVRWRGLARTGRKGLRSNNPGSWYPIFLNKSDFSIHSIGDAIDKDVDESTVKAPKGTIPVWPPTKDGHQYSWSTIPETLRSIHAKGGLKTGRVNPEKNSYPFYYLSSGAFEKIAKGEIIVTGRGPANELLIEFAAGSKSAAPRSVWNQVAHDAGSHGTSLLQRLIPGRNFPFPKSLYAVEDAVRFFVKNKPDAVVLDFFGGSGTTTHAVVRLNRQDGGRRQSILITNNEVSATEAQVLRSRGLRPGDFEWEKLGIFEYITRPRITSAITGVTPEGAPITGDYKFTDEFPMADGFEENIEFFELLYLDRNQVSRGKAFESIAPLLWMKAGSVGEMITKEVPPFAAPIGAQYAILFDVNYWQEFAEAVRVRSSLSQIFVVTDSLAQYQQIVTELPATVEVSMLYEDYLRNFEINVGGAL